METITPGANIAAALVKAQRNIKPVAKADFNDHHKFKYAAAEDVIDAARTALNSAGLAVLVLATTTSAVDVEYTDEDGKVIKDQERRMRATFLVVHEGSQETITCERDLAVIPGKGRPVDKAEATANTTMLSYFLRDLLNIKRGDDSDEMNKRDDSGHEQRAAARSSSGKAKANQYAGPCIDCGAQMQPNDGIAVPPDRSPTGKWANSHGSEAACKRAVEGVPETKAKVKTNTEEATCTYCAADVKPGTGWESSDGKVIHVNCAKVKKAEREAVGAGK